MTAIHLAVRFFVNVSHRRSVESFSACSARVAVTHFVMAHEVAVKRAALKKVLSADITQVVSVASVCWKMPRQKVLGRKGLVAV